MTQRERIAQQRALAEEALGKFKAISQLFGAEEGWDGRDTGLSEWQIRVKEWEEWIFNASPIA